MITRRGIKPVNESSSIEFQNLFLVYYPSFEYIAGDDAVVSNAVENMRLPTDDGLIDTY